MVACFSKIFVDDDAGIHDRSSDRLLSYKRIRIIAAMVAAAVLGRTVPSFRIVLQMEKEGWKPFRNALDKSDRKKVLDGMFDIPIRYIQPALICSPACKTIKYGAVNALLYSYEQLRGVFHKLNKW